MARRRWKEGGKTGFNITFPGWRVGGGKEGGKYYDQRRSGLYWSSTEQGSRLAAAQQFGADPADASKLSFGLSMTLSKWLNDKRSGYSCRCVRD